MTTKQKTIIQTTEEEEEREFAEKFPHLNRIPEVFQTIKTYFRNKKAHMFFLTNDVETVFHRHYPLRMYATHILSVDPKEKFCFIIVVRNSGRIVFSPVRDWTVTDHGIKFKEKHEYLSPSQVKEKFKKYIVDKLAEKMDWIEPMFSKEMGLFRNEDTFRLGNFTIPLLELIDNMILGTFSNWITGKEKTHPAKYGFPTLLIIENASMFFNEAIAHINPKYDIHYVIDLFNRWKSLPHARSSLIVMAEKDISSIDPRIRESFVHLSVPYPNPKIIKDWINWTLSDDNTEIKVPIPEKDRKKENDENIIEYAPLKNYINEENIQELTNNCRGLSLLEIEDVLVMMEPDKDGKIDAKKALERKKEIIRERYGAGLVEIFDQHIPLDHVILPKEQKEFIRKKIVKPIRRGKMHLAPRGILFMGPSGTGKTLLSKAIGTESKILVISLNIRHVLSKYVGESEARLRRVFELLRALKPCLVLMDEIDQQMMGRTARNNEVDGGTSSGIRGMMLDFMSDDRNEGVIFVSMTNAPERLDYAQTRSGRNDIRIPILLPDLNGRIDLMNLHLKLTGIEENIIQRTGVQDRIAELMNRANGYSGADIELIAKDVKTDFELEDFDEKKFIDILEFNTKDLNSSSRYSEPLTNASLRIASHMSAVPKDLRKRAKEIQQKENTSEEYNKMIEAFDAGTQRR